MLTTAKSALFSFFIGILQVSSAECGLSWNMGTVASGTIAFDVIGTVVITPFVVCPDGTMILQELAMIDNVNNYVFPQFIVNDPQVGVHQLGGLIYALTDAVVNINTESTNVSNGAITVVPRPTNPALLSSSPKAGEYVFLTVSMISASSSTN